jgi:hypothetical protein
MQCWWKAWDAWIFFLYFGFLIKFWEINLTKNLFSGSGYLESCQSDRHDLWRSRANAFGVIPVRPARLMKELHRVHWCDSWACHIEQVAPGRLAWLVCKIGHQPLFLFLPLFLSSFSSLHIAAALLAILEFSPLWKPVVSQIDSMSWYPNRVGYVRCLYHLILLYFEKFAWMSSCGRDLRLNQCICD